MQRFTLMTITSAACLAVAACGSPDVAETPETEIDTTLAAADIGDTAYPVAGELNEQQQAGLDNYDWQAASEEYETNRVQMSSAGSGTASMPSDGAMSSDGAMAGDSSMSDGSSSGATMTMPPRSQMDFTFLDRNGDGQLSVAEYAIWALPTNPTDPAPNDSTRPFMTQEEINKAGQTFFYFDEDGSTYLSQSEFEDARNSSAA